MVRAIRQQQPDAVFHLGDCERDTRGWKRSFRTCRCTVCAATATGSP